MVNIAVKGTAIYGAAESPITSGSVGRKVRFTFDESWDNLIKIAVFSCGDITKDIQLDNIDECDIPWEILVHDNVGKCIRIGICGLYDNAIVYPTVYTDIGKLLQGTRVSEDPSVDYTPTPTQQAITTANQALEIAESVREDADNGVFNGKSAYQSALENGYEGTEEEFGAGLADAANGGSEDSNKNGLTDEQAADLNANTEARHTHGNKTVSVPSDEVSYTHYNLQDKSGTIKGALDEAISYVTGVLSPHEHTHNNKGVLDNLADDNGTLTYNGEPIGGSSSLDIEVKTDTEDEYVLELTTPNETITTSNLKGKQGVSGVYVGKGDMPEGYNVQIIPDPVIEWFPPEEELPNAGAPSPDGGEGGSTTPTFTIEPIENGHRVTITDSNGSQSFDVFDGKDGNDYILTDTDKTEIANAVIDSLAVAEGGLY